MYKLTGHNCGLGKNGIIVKTGEWCQASPENTVIGDKVRRIERPDLHFEVEDMLIGPHRFHGKAVLTPLDETGEDILIDLQNFEVYKEA